VTREPRSPHFAPQYLPANARLRIFRSFITDGLLYSYMMALMNVAILPVERCAAISVVDARDRTDLKQSNALLKETPRIWPLA